MLKSYINQAMNYRFLLGQLVSRDFKTRYKRSVLGVVWSMLNPLLTMSVQYMIFSNLFYFYQEILFCPGVNGYAPSCCDNGQQ